MFKYNVFVIIMATVLFSCSKQLNESPISSTTTSNFFTNANDFSQAVTGVYSLLNGYPDEVMWMEEMRSDNVNASSDGNRDWQGINDFSSSISSAADISSAWADNFNGVYDANVVIAALDEKGGNIGDDNLKQRYYGEMYFLRAFFYFNLLKLYGKVPIINYPLSYTDVNTIGRDSVSNVYDFIIADLKNAASILPSSYSSSGTGRVTSGAANAFLGLVYLTKSGPTYNVSGPGLIANQYDSATYYFDLVINSGLYSLQSSYKDIFSYTNENNSEVIFDVQYNGTVGASFPGDLVSPYYWPTVGLTTNYGNGYGTCYFPISSTLKELYEPDSNIVDVRDTFNINYSYTSTFFKKYINIDYVGTSRTSWPINFIVMRYADVLLMKAECVLNGSSGSLSTVLGYVNQIRERAGLTDLSSLTIDDLFNERRREFAGEGLRWNDLVRSGNVVTTMNSWIESEGLSSSVSTVTNNSIIYPIPTDQVTTSNGLYTQNPGYD